MTPQQIMGFVRHALTLVGGIFLTKGWVDETTLTQVIGAVATLVGFGWSIYTHHVFSTNPEPAPAASDAKPTKK